jgi:IS5 family transposase
MDSFRTFFLRKAYQNVEKNGDRLAQVEGLLDWEAFRPIASGLYDNKGPKGGRPNVDEVLMVKLLVLQAWYGLSDPELERQALNRIDFQHFLGFPGNAPDYSTVWQFRECLAESGRDKLIWAELQRQLDEKGLKVRKGVVQDATFIMSDPGHAPADKPRGEDVAYLDKAFHGVEIRGFSAAMRRGSRDRPLSIWDRLRNARINRKRSPGERPFAVIKRVFGSGHVLVTTVGRVHVKMVFSCLCFNLVQLGSLGAVP